MTAKNFRNLRDDLYQRSPTSRARVDAEVERLTEQLGLAELRTKRERTQVELADAIGTTQSAVSRIERQHDAMVSTVADYIAATGGQLRLVADYGDYEIDIDLPAVRPAVHETVARTFRVIWQNPQTRQLVHVGTLTAHPDGYTFTYTTNAELDGDFQPFPAFPTLSREYHADQLFAFFADRAAAGAHGTITQIGKTLGLTARHTTPIELLTRSWGQTPLDTIQIVPDPEHRPDGTTIQYFLASGARHVDETNPDRVSKRIAQLKPNQQLEWREEPDNPANPRAIRLETNGQPLGWLPDYLLDQHHKHPTDARIYVEHANGPTTPWHLRLLCRLETAPETS